MKNIKIRIRLKKGKNEDGFTLIEVLVTIMVLAIVLIALFSCFIYGFTVISRMKQASIATQCLQEQLELIRNMPFNDILSLDSSFTNESLPLLEDSSGILSLEDSGGDDIKKLTVSVIWSYNGRQMRRDIVTFVTRKGINKR